MKIVILRKEDNLAVGGKLTVLNELNKIIFECDTLEDKIDKIPAGEYKVGFRKEGGFHTRYSDKFEFHVGMLEIKDVPGRKYILFHIGNRKEDTEGCVLVGKNYCPGWVNSSTETYKKFYPIIAKALRNREEVKVVIKEVKVVTKEPTEEKHYCPHCGLEIKVDVKVNYPHL